MSGRTAWWLVLGLLLGPAVLLAALFGVADPLSREVLGWRPDRFIQEPWRAWSAAWLHGSARHLIANLVGGLLVGALGWVLQAPRSAAWAWALAWPLTQIGLLLQPALQRYIGLSGVLHAGLAVAVVELLRRGRPRGERVLGLALGVGLLAKLLLEQPWGAPLRQVAGWDIAIAPLAHATGAFWGALLALAIGGFSRPRRSVG